MDPTGPRAVSVREAARLLGVCPQTIRSKVDSGELQGFRLGKTIRVLRSSIDRLLGQ